MANETDAIVFHLEGGARLLLEQTARYRIVHRALIAHGEKLSTTLRKDNEFDRRLLEARTQLSQLPSE